MKRNICILILVFSFIPFTVFSAGAALAQGVELAMQEEVADHPAAKEETADTMRAAPALPDAAATAAAKAKAGAAPAASAAAAHAAGTAPAARDSKNVFSPRNPRDPFLSQLEVADLEKARLAEEKRKEADQRRAIETERARMAELERKRLEEEELRKNPARAIINKIKVEGIMGNEAIINGNVVGIGGTILGARITRISDTSVTFVYKGQTFVKKLPLSGVN